jgi:hypothetical protein
MSSDLMDHLREECGDIFGDLAPQRLGEARPDAFRPDKHGTSPLSSVRAMSSCIASTVSLLGTPRGSHGARLVAATGSFSSMRSW